MTEKRFWEIVQLIKDDGVNTLNGGLLSHAGELFRFAEPHFTKPKLYQQCLEIPEPVRDAGVMRHGQFYHIPRPTFANKYDTEVWSGDDFDTRVLESGLVYLTPEDAIKRAEAMLAVEHDV